MPTVYIPENEDSIVLHFGGEFTRINAYTLATALVNIADAAKAANKTLNPGYEIEIVVEAFGPGSFKALVRSIYKSAGNLFSNDLVKGFILGVVTNVFCQYALPPNNEVTVNVGPDEVLIQQGDKKIVVPRAVHDATKQVERNSQFRKGIGQAIKAIETDPAIASFGISRSMAEPPPFDIPRVQFAAISEDLSQPDADSRDLEEVTDVRIVRAILYKSKRRWEFVWNDIKIAAPVTDDEFYNKFFSRQITIAPGDSLHVRLKIHQKWNQEAGVFVNKSYEVVEVMIHNPRPSQETLDLNPTVSLPPTGDPLGQLQLSQPPRFRLQIEEDTGSYKG
ncbi:hypothetical protein [Geomonas oryzae]|uniref:hypothetical protein n=1 Tax=Geomonas oryzae TaxID=2364273 RepID=UPI00100C1BF7|nr:hypothetical protein [Geomonas oryzae]